jgi:cysteine desulfurase/selenocysteine lyase
LDNATHYLDFACYGPPLPSTVKSVQDLCQRMMVQEGTSGTKLTVEWMEAVNEARSACASLISTEPSQIALVNNTTHGLGIIASSLVDLVPGDNVLVSDQEFPGGVTVWRSLSRDRGIEVRSVPTSGGRVEVSDFQKKADSRTAVLLVSAVQEVSGFRVDLRAFRDLASSLDALLLVDGIQEVGAIPVDVNFSGVDAYCAGGHKWLRSPFGVGFLYLHPRLLDRLSPPYLGYLGFEDPPNGWEAYLRSYHRTTFDNTPISTQAKRLETGGIPNFTGSLALKHAVEELVAVGTDSVWERISSLTSRLREGLHLLGIDLVAQSKEVQDHGSESGIVCFSFPSGVEEEDRLMNFLESQKVFISLRRLSGIGGIRVSPHFDSSEADIDRLLDILENFV